jgi:hypothetical protein
MLFLVRSQRPSSNPRIEGVVRGKRFGGLGGTAAVRAAIIAYMSAMGFLGLVAKRC